MSSGAEHRKTIAHSANFWFPSKADTSPGWGEGSPRDTIGSVATSGLKSPSNGNPAHIRWATFCRCSAARHQCRQPGRTTNNSMRSTSCLRPWYRWGSRSPNRVPNPCAGDDQRHGNQQCHGHHPDNSDRSCCPTERRVHQPVDLVPWISMSIASHSAMGCHLSNSKPLKFEANSTRTPTEQFEDNLPGKSIATARHSSLRLKA